jgi:glycosyltransferase involved in cell wall biosynthesis
MNLPKRALYIWQSRYPWDIRVDKITRALRHAGYAVEILARRFPGDDASSPGSGGIEIRRVGPPLPRALSLPVPGNPLWARAIHARVRALRPSVIIARDIPLALPAIAAGRSAGVPVVIDMAEHYPVAMRTWKKYQRDPFSRFLVNTLRLPDRIERRAVLGAAGVLSVCEEQCDRLLHDYAIDPARLVSVLNTPERTRIPAMPAGGFHRRGSVFGYHGILAGDRDVATVVRGFSLAAATDPAVRLVICGDGESMPEVKRDTEKSKFRDRIELRGRFRPEETTALYEEVDFGVVSWVANEFSNVTIANKFFDYAAFGKPMLYTRVKPMERLMKEMRCGVSYESGDAESVARAMLALAGADYGAMASAGRAAIDRDLNWDTDSARLVNFLSRLEEKR